MEDVMEAVDGALDNVKTAMDHAIQVREYWPLIGPYRSRDLNTVLVIGSDRSLDLNTVL